MCRRAVIISPSGKQRSNNWPEFWPRDFGLYDMRVRIQARAPA